MAAMNIARTMDDADAVWASATPDERAQMRADFDRGVSPIHAANLVRTRRRTSAAAGMDIDGAGDNAPAEATPTQSALVQAGDSATGGGMPTLVAAYNALRGRGAFVDNKKQATADLAEMQSQNPIAAGVAGQGAGLLLPAAGGFAAGAAGSAANAARGGASGLLSLIKSGVAAGAPLGALQGALQTDTGDVGDVLENAAGGAAKGAAAGIAGNAAGRALLKLAPSLATTAVGDAARAPLATAKQLGGEVLDNGEDLAVHGDSALLRMLARAAPKVGKVLGAVGAGQLARPFGSGVSHLAASAGGEYGAKAGNSIASKLQDLAIAPYTGGRMELPEPASSPPLAMDDTTQVVMSPTDLLARIRSATPATPSSPVLVGGVPWDPVNGPFADADAAKVLAAPQGALASSAAPDAGTSAARVRRAPPGAGTFQEGPADDLQFVQRPTQDLGSIDASYDPDAVQASNEAAREAGIKAALAPSDMPADVMAAEVKPQARAQMRPKGMVGEGGVGALADRLARMPSTQRPLEIARIAASYDKATAQKVAKVAGVSTAQVRWPD